MTGFAERLRTARRKAGLTQEELAQYAAYSRSSIANMERGAQDPTLSGLHALADVLGTTAAELIKEGPGPVNSLLLTQIEDALRQTSSGLRGAVARLHRQTAGLVLLNDELVRASNAVSAAMRGPAAAPEVPGHDSASEPRPAAF